MRVLITGGNGFLGRYLVERLVARGDQVRALVRQADPDLRQAGAEVFLGDVRDAVAMAAAVRGIDTVLHTAARAGIWGPWREYYQTNTLGTRHLLQASQKSGVQRFIFTSSPSVTFQGSDQCGVDESVPYASRWLCAYPHTKALAEQEVLAAHGVQGVATCALRPHLIWGPRDRHLVPRLVARARQGKLLQVGDGRNRIDTIFVDNAVDAHLQAADNLSLTSAVGGRAYFLSQGEPVNCWHWINEVLAHAGLPRVTRRISASMAWMLGACLEGVHAGLRLTREPRMTRFLAAQLSTSHYFDITAARRDLNYEPRVSNAEGLARLQFQEDLPIGK